VAFEAHVPHIAQAIQLAIAPVFMLTALGAILGALNVRLGRALDRRRQLEEKLPALSPDELPSARAELAVIARRVWFVYLSILFAVVSALFICLLIAGAFLGAFVSMDISRTIAAMFVAAMLALIACLLLFLREIFLAVSSPRHVPR
jgi:NADH:ubiquinone oxidoreductase subunit 3 (subunit A)